MEEGLPGLAHLHLEHKNLFLKIQENTSHLKMSNRKGLNTIRGTVTMKRTVMGDESAAGMCPQGERNRPVL